MTSGKIIVDHKQVWIGGQSWKTSTEDPATLRDGVVGHLPKDGSGVSLQQLLAVAGVTTPPKWVRMTLIGAGGGGGCGKGAHDPIYNATWFPTGGGGGGGGAIVIVEASGDLAQAAWDASYSLSVGRGGWYNAPDHTTFPKLGVNVGGVDVLDISNIGIPNSDVHQGTGGGGYLWNVPTTTLSHEHEPRWLWSGDGGDCTWGLLNADTANSFGVSGGKSGHGPSANGSSYATPNGLTDGVSNFEWPGYSRGGAGGALQAIDFEDDPTDARTWEDLVNSVESTTWWKVVAGWSGNEGVPYFNLELPYGGNGTGAGGDAIGWNTSMYGALPAGNPATGRGYAIRPNYADAGASGGAAFSSNATLASNAGGSWLTGGRGWHENLGPNILPVWGVGGRTRMYRKDPSPGGGVPDTGVPGVSAAGYGAGGSGAVGGSGIGEFSQGSAFIVNSAVGVWPGGAGGDGALIIEWGPSRS